MIDHLQNRVRHLEEEHARLDKRIDGMESTGVFEDVTLEVLKKQRLHIRDELVKLRLNIAYELGATEND
jgi:uncharacterized protein YdcH (DUF465 family)